jgi:hypothetical protein
MGQELLTSALDGDEWPASRPDHFSPGIHTIGWMGPRADFDAAEKRNRYPPPQVEIQIRFLCRQPSHCSDWATEIFSGHQLY